MSTASHFIYCFAQSFVWYNWSAKQSVAPLVLCASDDWIPAPDLALIQSDVIIRRKAGLTAHCHFKEAVGEGKPLC